MLHKGFCTEHKQIQGHLGTGSVLPEERIPYMNVLDVDTLQIKEASKTIP